MNYACYTGQGSHFSSLRTRFSNIQIISTCYPITQNVMLYIVDNDQPRGLVVRVSDY